MSRHKIPRAELAHSTITLSIPSVIALILVPLIVAAGLIGTTWKMTDRLGQVKAAIVNNDAGTKINGQLVPLGRQLSGGLIDSKSQTTDGRTITWELSDNSKASEGLKDGTYAAVVTIPKSFSKDATSYSANKGSQATSAVVDVNTSDSSPVTDTTVASMTAQAAERSINKTLSSQYLDNIYIGFNKSASSMVSLSKGAKQLDTGAAGLNSGIKQSTAGAKQLSTGMNQLSTGGQQLATSGNQMVVGVKQLATGINALDTNGQKLAAGGTQLSSGGKQLSSGVSQLSTGLNQMDKQLQSQTSSSGDTSKLEQLKTGANGVADGTDGLNKLLNGYQKTLSGGQIPAEQAYVRKCAVENATTPTAAKICQDSYEAGVKGAGDLLKNFPTDSTGTKTVDILDASSQTNSGAKKYAAGLSTAIDALIKQLKALPAQMKQLQSGVHQIATNTSKLSTGVTQYTTGVSTYTSGVSQYMGGVHTLNKQMPTLTSGISQYVSGVGTYTNGVSQAATGVSQFYDGQVKLSQGASKYATGVNTFATQLAKGAKQVPTYSASDRQKLSDAVSTPVNTSTSSMGTSAWVVALVVILGLWLGALAMWMVARTVPSSVLTSSKSSLKLLWSSVSTGALVTGISALGLTIIAGIATDLSVGRWFGLLGMLLLIGAMCLAVNHALAAWLHSIGRFIALAFFVVAAAVGVVSAVPKAVQWVYDISPLKPAMEGVTAILAGNTPTFGSFMTIILWMVIGAVASLLAVNRARHTTASKVVGEIA